MSRPLTLIAATLFACAVLASALALVACAPTEPTGDGPNLRGVVTSVNVDGERPNLLVVWDESLGAQLEYDAASVTLADGADVFRNNEDATYTRLSAEDLKVGDVVDVRLTGPVRESYPVQADADLVVVVDEWPESKPLPTPPGLAPPPE